MKNFTKENFKTNSLWIRLLIMAFMLLAGSSSVWAAIVYYVNKDNWEDVYIHYWGGSGGSDWNGNQKMGYTNSNILGFKIYSYEIGNNNSFIFKRYKGDSDNNKTGDITGYTEQKPYYYDGTWYTSVNDIINSISRYVAGEPAAVFGETWKENKVENKMTGNQNGLYSITYSSVSGSNVNAMSFKITDGSWSHAWPDNNYEVPNNYDTNKTYNVTITYKFSDNSINVTAEEVAVTYTITYKDQGGGTFSGTHETGYPTKHTYGTATTLKTATKDGYDFLGWFTSSDCSGTAVTTLDATTYTSNIILYAKWEEICYQSATEGEGLYSNGNITLSAEFNTCGNAFIGFQWKEKNSNWCYEDNSSNPCFIPLRQNNISNETVTTTVNKSGGTFVFRPYIVVGNNAQDWLYGDEFEVVTCSDPSAGYSISNENASVDWDGTEKEVIITTVNGYATPSKIYYEESETKPTAVGEYTITIDVPSNGTYCPATGLKIGTFEILCATATSANFTISNTTFTYNENKQTPTVTPNAGVGTATATYKQGDTTVESPTNAGTYDIYVTTEAGTGYCAITTPTKIGYFTIDKKDVSKEEYTMSPVEFTYNGDKQVPIITPESGVGIVRSTEYKLNNTTVVENPTDAGTYTVYITSDAGTNYTAASSLELGTFTIAKKAPSKTDFSYVAEKDYTGSALSAEVNWIQNTGSGDINTYYKVNGAADNTYTTEEPTAAGTYIVAVTTDADVNYAAATTRIELGEFVINCPSVAAPAITTPATVCAGTPVTLSNYNGVNINTVKWYSNSECTSEVTEQVTPTDGTKYYAKAYHEASGCYSSQYSTLTFTVNPLPTITEISGNNTAVLYEDVELTATGVTQGAEVKWYLDNDETPVATGTTYTVTSETAGEIKVKAKAFLNGCESGETSHTVTFSAEDCTPVPSSDIKITFKTPSNNGKNGQYWGIGSLYYKKDNGASYTEVKLYENDNCQGGEQTSQEVTISNLQNNATVYFKACYDYGGYTATTKTLTLTKGNKYIIGIISDENPSSTNSTNKTSEVGIKVTSETPHTQDPPIKAPAVKMVSAEYDEVNDIIVAKGAVYKTGCGVTFWGFQYSTDGQTWGTADTDFIRPNTDNSLSVPGEFEYSFAIPKAGGGDIYYIRAYALNNYNGSYALSNAVYSATSLPVEIPSKTIESATISLVDSEGEPSDATVVCPQSTVYLKVSYVGGDFKDYEAADNFPGTNLELVNHDKANNYAIFSYTATATGVANITISNDNTSIAPTNGVSITLKDVAPVSAPMISISQATICENGSATITVNNPIAGLTYTLYKETTKIAGPVIHNAGDLIFNVTEAGSYTVCAEESVCKNYANSMAVELKVVTNDVKIGLAVDKTTVNPWQPLKLTVTPPEGYAYTIDGLADVVYTQSGDVYTIKIPRPNDWSPGNSGDPVKTMSITFSAKIQVSDDLTCGSSSITVKLEDTEENCK